MVKIVAKVTLSVPDDLYERIEALKDQLNLSEIFRVCVSQEIEKLAGTPNAEIVSKLKDYLQEKSPFETTRTSEINRFTSRWGQPDIITPNEKNPPYVAVMKTQPITVGEKTLELRIFNNLMIPHDIRPRLRTNVDLEEWNNIVGGKIADVIDYFKSIGFGIGEGDISSGESAILEGLLSDDEIQGISKGRHYVIGLFAYDKNDMVLIEVLLEERSKRKH